MIVEWLPIAESDRDRQLAYIAERSPRASIDIGDALEASVRRLAEFPEIGRPGRVAGTRERVVIGTPYVIVYRVEPGVALVLRLLHGAQHWPTDP